MRQFADFRIVGRQYSCNYEQRHALLGYYRETDHRDVSQGLLGGQGQQSSAVADRRGKETQTKSSYRYSHRTNSTLRPVSPVPSFLQSFI